MRKNNQRIIAKPHVHLHTENIWKVSKQLVENCKRSCAHKVPSIFSSERSTELGDSIISLLKNSVRLQGHVTPKWLIRSGRNSNSSEILCLSWLPASLTKIRSKMNELACGHYFPIIYVYGKSFRLSRTLNSVGNGPIWPKSEYSRYRGLGILTPTQTFKLKSSVKQL